MNSGNIMGSNVSTCICVDVYVGESVYMYVYACVGLVYKISYIHSYRHIYIYI